MPGQKNICHHFNCPPPVMFQEMGKYVLVCVIGKPVACTFQAKSDSFFEGRSCRRSKKALTLAPAPNAGEEVKKWGQEGGQAKQANTNSDLSCCTKEATIVSKEILCKTMAQPRLTLNPIKVTFMGGLTSRITEIHLIRDIHLEKTKVVNERCGRCESIVTSYSILGAADYRYYIIYILGLERVPKIRVSSEYEYLKKFRAST